MVDLDDYGWLDYVNHSCLTGHVLGLVSSQDCDSTEHQCIVGLSQSALADKEVQARALSLSNGGPRVRH